MPSTMSGLIAGLRHIGSVCDHVQKITDIPLQWPDLTHIKIGIDDVYSALRPILDFFQQIRSALSQDLCIPNPLEALAEWELIE